MKNDLMPNMSIKFASQYHGFSCRSMLKAEEVPVFLKNYIQNDEQPILTCQNLYIDYLPSALDGHIRNIMVAKLLLTSFDQLYHFASSKGVQGILFMLPDDQTHFLRFMEDLFCYWQPHIDQKGERTYLYLTTGISDYDYFVEASEEMTRDLDKVLEQILKTKTFTRH